MIVATIAGDLTTRSLASFESDLRVMYPGEEVCNRRRLRIYGAAEHRRDHSLEFRLVDAGANQLRGDVVFDAPMQSPRFGSAKPSETCHDRNVVGVNGDTNRQGGAAPVPFEEVHHRGYGS